MDHEPVVSRMVTRELINDLLNNIKERYGLTSDEALARHLTQQSGIMVHQMYIWRWRRGEYGRTAMPVLAGELVRFGSESHQAA